MHTIIYTIFDREKIVANMRGAGGGRVGGDAKIIAVHGTRRLFPFVFCVYVCVCFGRTSSCPDTLLKNAVGRTML